MKRAGHLAGAVSLLYMCLVQAGEPVDRIVAVVNDDVIMETELRDRMRTIEAQLQQRNQSPPPSNIFQQQILESIILSKVQLQMAAQTGIRVDDETLNMSIRDMARGNGVSLREFREILEKDGFSFEKFREDIRSEITIGRLKQRQIVNRIVVTEREIDNFLANAEMQGILEIKYQIGHILISVPEGSTEEEIMQRKMIAEQSVNDLREGQDFAELARQISDGQQASEGGDLGWRKSDEVPSLFAPIVKDMKVGDISDVIENASGFHIIKLLGSSSGETKMIDQTRSRHILIKVNEITTDDVAKEKLQQFLYRIEQGESFQQIAKSNSDDMVSALEGGDLGWRGPGELVPQFEQEMNELEIGEVSEPFKTQFGWHILKVVDRRKFDNTQNARRTQAREAIRQRKIKENEEEWLRNLREGAFVEYRLDG